MPIGRPVASRDRLRSRGDSPGGGRTRNEPDGHEVSDELIARRPLPASHRGHLGPGKVAWLPPRASTQDAAARGLRFVDADLTRTLVILCTPRLAHRAPG